VGAGLGFSGCVGGQGEVERGAQAVALLCRGAREVQGEAER
jgi:hypothetical protein